MLSNMDKQLFYFLSTDDSMIYAMLSKERLHKEDTKMTYMQSLWANHVEDVRSHKANEQLKSAELEETKRSHQVNEALSRDSLNETIRHQVAQDTETMRHNMVSESEIERHNRNTESIMRTENNIKAMSAQLTYQASMSKIATEKEIEEMKNDTNTFLTLAQQRINEMNAGSQKVQAQASLVSAQGAANRGIAALEQAAVARDLSTSQKVKNYTGAVHDVASSVSEIGDLVLDAKMLPARMAQTSADTLSKQTQAQKNVAQAKQAEYNTGQKSKVTDNWLGEIVRKSERGGKSK